MKYISSPMIKIPINVIPNPIPNCAERVGGDSPIQKKKQQLIFFFNWNKNLPCENVEKVVLDIVSFELLLSEAVVEETIVVVVVVVEDVFIDVVSLVLWSVVRVEFA